MRLYGVAEVAAGIGRPKITPKRVANWLARGNYEIPQPDVRLACGPVWYADTIEPWIASMRG